MSIETIEKIAWAAMLGLIGVSWILVDVVFK